MAFVGAPFHSSSKRQAPSRPHQQQQSDADTTHAAAAAERPRSCEGRRAAMQFWASSSRGAVLRGRGEDARTRIEWSPFWAVAALEWRQYDLVSTASSAVLSTFNVWRCMLTSSSYSTPAHLALLRRLRAAYVLTQACCLGSMWLLLRYPQAWQRHRVPLTMARWLLVELVVAFSTPLPLFQAMRMPSLCEGTPLCRAMEVLFHSGTLYCITAHVFHRLPWQHALLAALANAVIGSLVMPGPYCSHVLETALAAGGQQQHSDAALLQGLASRLDLLIGQGSMQQPAPGAPLAWQPQAAAVAARCPPAALLGDGGDAAGCRGALLGQCRAVVVMLHFGIALVLAALVFVLERVNKWRFLQLHPRLRHQQWRGGGGGGSSGDSSSASSTSSSGGGGRGRSERGDSPGSGGSSGASGGEQQGSGWGLLTSPYDAPSIAVLVRNELLKFLLLLDVPLLLLWWGLSAWLRPELLGA